jgi:hypothetical protein
MNLASDYSDLDWQEELYSRDLARGILPHSLLLWLIAGWFYLYIIRPWEVLFPWMAPWHVERIYCLGVLGVLALSGQLRIDFSRQTLTLGLLIGAMIISAVSGINYLASQETIYKFLVHVAMYVAMISVIRKPRDLLCIAAIYLIVMTMYLGKSQWEYHVHNRHDFTQGVSRLIGIDRTYRHYNSVAGSAVLTIPFCHLLWTMRRDIGRALSAAAQRRLALGIAGFAILAITSVLLTNSRGGMLGLLIAFFLSCVTGKNVRRAIRGVVVGGLVLIPVVLVAVPETQKTRFSSLWDTSVNASAQSSVELRKQAALDGLRMFSEHPVTGVGVGNFKRYRVMRGDTSDLAAHNGYVDVLGEMGIIGGVAFCLFVLCIWKNFREIRRLAEQSITVESEFLGKLALAGRNSLLLLLFFGLIGANLDRFNWFWLAGIGVAGVAMGRQAIAAAQDADWEPFAEVSSRG